MTPLIAKIVCLLLCAIFNKASKCYRSNGDATMGTILHNIGDISNASPKQLRQIREALHEHGVVVIKNQTLSRQQQVDLSAKLGEKIVLPPSFEGKDPEVGFPEIHRVTNYWYNGTWKGKRHCFGCYWHKDGNYNNPDQDYIVGILHAENVSESSTRTGFLDNCKAVSLIPDSLRQKIKNTIMTVSVRRIPDFKQGTEEDLALFPVEALHDIFYRHPENGRLCMYLTNEMTTKQAKNETEKHELNEAWRIMTEEAPKYSHKWSNGDVLFWDNVGVMHRAMPSTPTKDPRIMFRTMVRIPMAL